jgi:hypothetical protein
MVLSQHLPGGAEEKPMKNLKQDRHSQDKYLNQLLLEYE